MLFLIISIAIISAVAAFLLLKKQYQAPAEQPTAPVVVEEVKKAEPKKKMAAKPVEKAPTKKPTKNNK